MPFMGPYVASKHALEGMSESLRRELMIFGIEVIVIGPGAIKTPLWDKTEVSDLDSYSDTVYGPILKGVTAEFMRRGQLGLPAERVAQDTWLAMTAKKPKLRYAPVPNKFREWTLPKFIPTRLLDRLLARMFKLQRQ
jgi:short-subunit dehydrogenase